MRTKLTNKKTPGNNSNKNKTNALEKLKFFTFVSVRVSYKDYILHTRCAVVVVGFFFFWTPVRQETGFQLPAKRVGVCVSAKEQGIGKRMTSANHKADATATAAATRFPSSAAAVC